MNRGDAQEAVARIAVQDGLYEQIKQEFIPQNNGLQRPNFPPPSPQITIQGSPHTYMMQKQPYPGPPQGNRFPSQGFAPPRPQQQQQQYPNNQRPVPSHQQKARPTPSLRSTPGGPPLPPQLGAIGGATTAGATNKANGASPALSSKKATPVKATPASTPVAASTPTLANHKKKGGEKPLADRAFASLNRSCAVLLGDDKSASYDVDEDSASTYKYRQLLSESNSC